MLNDRFLFLSRCLQNPNLIGAITPSSRWLTSCIAAALPKGVGRVVEIGAGTGAVTRALIAAGVAPENLIVVERDDCFHDLLCRRFAGVTVLKSDAIRLQTALADSGIAPVSAIVSSLPLLRMSPSERFAIVEQIFATMEPNGSFVQFTYRPASPLPQADLAALGIRARRVARVLLNLPPATVWQYERLPAAGLAGQPTTPIGRLSINGRFLPRTNPIQQWDSNAGKVNGR